MSYKKRPYQFGFLVFIIALIASWISLRYATSLIWELEAIISWNIAAFFLMGFDKFQATQRWPRVPEKVFYTVTVLGGTIGILLGMQAFRHKTRKTSFQMVIAFLILIQLGLAAWYFDVL